MEKSWQWYMPRLTLKYPIFWHFSDSKWWPTVDTVGTLLPNRSKVGRKSGQKVRGNSYIIQNKSFLGVIICYYYEVSKQLHKYFLKKKCLLNCSFLIHYMINLPAFFWENMRKTRQIHSNIKYIGILMNQVVMAKGFTIN